MTKKTQPYGVLQIKYMLSTETSFTAGMWTENLNNSWSVINYFYYWNWSLACLMYFVWLSKHCCVWFDMEVWWAGSGVWWCGGMGCWLKGCRFLSNHYINCLPVKQFIYLKIKLCLNVKTFLSTASTGAFSPCFSAPSKLLMASPLKSVNMLLSV